MLRFLLISLFLILSFQGQANAYACYNVGENDLEVLLEDAHYFGLMKLVKTDEDYHYIENIQTYWGAEDTTFKVNKMTVTPDGFYPTEEVLFEHIILQKENEELKFLRPCKTYLLPMMEKYHRKAESTEKFTAIEQKCNNQNGDFLYLDYKNLWYCALKTRDSGKICQSSSNCEGLCFVELASGEDRTVRKQWSLNYCKKTGGRCLHKEGEVGDPIIRRGQCSEYQNYIGQFFVNNKDGVAELLFCGVTSCKPY